MQKIIGISEDAYKLINKYNEGYTNIFMTKKIIQCSRKQEPYLKKSMIRSFKEGKR